MIRVILPAPLREMARLPEEVELDRVAEGSLAAVLDEIERRYPALRGLIRDSTTLRRRPFIRFFACREDLSHEPPHLPLPPEVLEGKEPLLIIGAMAGG